MSHSSEKRWEGVAGIASTLCINMVDTLLEAENNYQDLLELYNYKGNDAQALADQLFYDIWSVRSQAGTQAEITVDVVASVITNPIITVAGTGYINGTGFVLGLADTAGGGGGDAFLRYDIVAGAFTNISIQNEGTGYLNGTGYSVKGIAAPQAIFDTQANADELARVQDVISAMTSLHELYQAADNVAVAQEDRISSLRRFT